MQESVLSFSHPNPPVTIHLDPAIQAIRPELGGCRILVIEDEVLVALHMVELIAELGCEAAGVATSMRTALAEIKATVFDCVTLDIDMSGSSSFHIARRLRDRNIPFVFCTAYSHFTAEFPGVPVIEKPLTKEALAAGLLKALKGKLPAG